MALPMNTAVTYNLTIPSTGKLVNYRPFLIKEEKALLVAQQSESPKVMMDTLKQVIKDCIKDEVDTDALATFDLEYIFLQLRAKSVGEIVELLLKCEACADDAKAVTQVNIDLTKLEVTKGADHTNKIELFGDVGVIMKYPSLDTLEKLGSIGDGDYDKLFDAVSGCIDSIYTTEEVFHTKDQTKQDVLDFLNNLTSDQFAKIQKFFETMPRLRKEISYSCPVCNKKHDKVLEGIGSFF
jgi:hypothetical protein